MKNIPYAQWFSMLTLIMVGSGVFGVDVDTLVVRPYDFNLDHDSFRHAYEAGLSPMEAYLVDINEGGE
ncbi:hypothetical protein [Pedobacter nyackensis]|uniref:Uncharacterized protein n=1 Tax=Pedobacter nyackensis TaxID=475255 RepID=A0A1W1ZXE9_9SPHI|nr:hypothetical protein [Pedobacter nyackensis]SMC53097.1 hypothetical protein SAMN04488101_101128 [Pedobacter nyackensis]